MSKDVNEYLRHIQDECDYLISVIVNISLDDFLEDETLKRATVRSLEIIGEASKKIPLTYKDTWSFIEWRSMAGMRDRLIHDYIGVNYIIVWDVLQTKIPVLRKDISKILERKN